MASTFDKWEFLKQFRKSSKTKNFTKYINDTINDFATITHPWKRSRMTTEEIFGVFIVICGVIAAVANALILIAVIKQMRSSKKYPNVLFMIITNFALIDEFKALCAIYIGSVLISVYSKKASGEPYILLFKMLQVSVFMMHCGNLCSVFNLIIATLNEFVQIKFTWKYHHVVTKYRAAVAIAMTWICAVALSVIKALIGGASFQQSSSVMVPVRTNLANDSHAFDDSLQENVTDHDEIKPVLRRSGGTSPSDIYTLVILVCLLMCLFIVSLVYYKLYRTIKKSQQFQKRNVLKSFKQKDSDDLPSGSAIRLKKLNQKHTRFNIKHRSSSLTSMDQIEVLSTSTTDLTRPRTYTLYAKNQDQCIRNKRRQLRKQKSTKTFRRYKCVVVILMVCAVNFAYLAVYFALQLLHWVHLHHGVSLGRLKERYMINFLLRTLFVLHASLNPIIFFRIKSFRATFFRLFQKRLNRKQDRSNFNNISTRRLNSNTSQSAQFKYTIASSTGTETLI